MLLDGFNHVAVITADTDRLHAFYREVFEATVSADHPAGPGGNGRFSSIDVGPGREINVFENLEADPPARTPMFARGPVDHMALQATSVEAFDEIRRRLMARGASDGFVTDFGPALSCFFIDPDGLECEVLVPNPNAEPGVFNPPGTKAEGYEIGVP